MDQNTLDNISLSTEEVLGPPKVDMVGFFLVSLLALVIGFLIGILVFLGSYLFLGGFSLSSGASPIIIAMIVFFSTSICNMLFVWGLSSIFPHIYAGTKTLYMQVSIFTIVLYICMSGVYVVVNTLPIPPSTILAVYVVHIMLDIFGLMIITGILSLYRYAILIFYSSIASLLVTGLIPLLAFTSLATSSNTLFIFMGFSAIVFFIASFTNFGLLSLYYRIYASSGYDPLGDVIGHIQDEERQREKDAENRLFS